MKNLHFVLDEKANVTLDAFLFEKSPEMKDSENRPAVLVCPGGGYFFCSDREADPVAMNYAAAGYNTFVLRYSVKEFGVFPRPIYDLCKAIKFIRDNAEEFGVIKNQIATIGFSAGGHLVLSQSCLWSDEKILAESGCTAEECRPDAVMAGYPVTSTAWAEKFNEIERILENVDEENKKYFNAYNHVTKDNPPTFLFHTFRDNVVPVEDSLVYAAALAKYDVPFELHVFPNGWHGMSVADRFVNATDASLKEWKKMSVAWLERIFLNPDEANAPVDRSRHKY